MADGSNDKLYSILGYLGILVLVPILAGKDSAFCRFHANQGLVLLFAEILSSVLFGIGFFPFGLLGWLLGAACFVLSLIGIISAANMEMKPLPVIGSIRILK